MWCPTPSICWHTTLTMSKCKTSSSSKKSKSKWSTLLPVKTASMVTRLLCLLLLYCRHFSSALRFMAKNLKGRCLKTKNTVLAVIQSPVCWCQASSPHQGPVVCSRDHHGQEWEQQPRLHKENGGKHETDERCPGPHRRQNQRGTTCKSKHKVYAIYYTLTLSVLPVSLGAICLTTLLCLSV